MRNKNDVCHIAIPCRDLEETALFYEDKLGCKVARQKKDRVTFNFFGDQLVCHLCPEEVPQEAKEYPRHFGITFRNKKDFIDLLEILKTRNVEIISYKNRFEGEKDEHKTFFVKDPSNNLVEFKWYFDSEMMY